LEQKSRKPSEIISKRRFLLKIMEHSKRISREDSSETKIKFFPIPPLFPEIYHEKSSFRQDRRSFALGSEQDEFS